MHAGDRSYTVADDGPRSEKFTDARESPGTHRRSPPVFTDIRIMIAALRMLKGQKAVYIGGLGMRPFSALQGGPQGGPFEKRESAYANKEDAILIEKMRQAEAMRRKKVTTAPEAKERAGLSALLDQFGVSESVKDQLIEWRHSKL